MTGRQIPTANIYLLDKLIKSLKVAGKSCS